MWDVTGRVEFWNMLRFQSKCLWPLGCIGHGFCGNSEVKRIVFYPGLVTEDFGENRVRFELDIEGGTRIFFLSKEE